MPHGRLFLFAALSVLAVSVAHPQRHLKTLGAVSEIPAGAGSRSLMTGDFNGDGLTDVAAAGDNGITVLYQRPESLRWDQTTLSVNKPILASAAGRCNRDRMTDIAVITDDPPQLRVYLARPGEKFVSAWTTALSALFSNLLVADLDNDGRPDIVLYGTKQLGIVVMRGRADGSFQPGVTLLPESSIGALSVEDVNGDGISDIVAEDWVSDQLMIFTGFGHLNFSDPVVIQLSSEPRLFSSAHLDAGPNTDFVVCLPDERLCRLYQGDGLGGFKPGQEIPLSGTPRRLAAADVNGDGFDDFGILSTDDRSLTIELNSGEEVEDSVQYFAGVAPTDFAFLKHGWTGFVDAVVLDSAASRIRIMYNALIDQGGAGEMTYALGLHPDGVLAADIDRDGWNDIVVADSRSRALSIFLNNASGGFQGQISFRTPGGLTWLEYLPKDDSLSLLVGTNPDSAMTSIVEINNRTWSHSVFQLPTQGEPSIISGELDASSRGLRLLVLEQERKRGGGDLYEYVQIGPSRFIERSVEPDLPRPVIASTVCEWRRGAARSIISLVYDGRKKRQAVYFSPRDSGGGFGAPRLAATLDSTLPAGALLWSADLNNDGLPDLVADFQDPGNLLEVLLGRPDTTFSTPPLRVHPPVSVSARYNLRILDMNDDGAPDIVLANQVTRSIEEFLGVGNGSFIQGPHLMSTRSLGGFTIEDIDRDGIPELIMTDFTSGLLKILSLESDEQ